MRLEHPPAPSAAESTLAAEEVKAIRYKVGQSREAFAAMIGVTLATLQGWEEGRHHPEGPALALLRVTAKNPKIVAKALMH
jgi:putative transcriptional regulator